MKRSIALLTTWVILAVPALAAAATWVIDADHSSIGFKIRHLMVTNVKGDFKKYSGTIEIDDKDLAKSKVNVVIDTASIDTGIAKRDDHLRSADFFDVAKYPTMTYVSRKVVPAGEGRLKVYGDLTLHGVTKEVILDVEGPTATIKDPWGNTKRGASATAKINRKDFGLTWNKAIEAGGVAVGDEVTILIEVELQKK
jgi:polyisoprenoid-binding protein YceI